VQRLNLNKCEITTEYFVPEIISDKNLYDDLLLESGTITCNLLCNGDEESINKNITKYVMMLQAYNDGYIKALRGEDFGLKQVFGIVGQPKYMYKGGNNLEVVVDIITIVYNPCLHMTVINDCLAAGITTTLLPGKGNYRYFDVKSDKKLIMKPGSERIINALETQKEPYRKAIVSNITPL
jgi:hypothetical protein